MIDHFLTATYSNLENHPRLIRARDPKPVAKIILDPKTGLPSVAGPLGKPSPKIKPDRSRVSFKESDDDSGSDTDTQGTLTYYFTPDIFNVTLFPVRHQAVARPRDETKEEKKARKAAVKAERQSRRVDKKATKEQFGAELKVQMRAIGNKEKRLKKL